VLLISKLHLLYVKMSSCVGNYSCDSASQLYNEKYCVQLMKLLNK